jgi:hypothetical protein
MAIYDTMQYIPCDVRAQNSRPSPREPTRHFELGQCSTSSQALISSLLLLQVSTVCFGTAASMGAFLLCTGARGKRKSLPNSRIMIHQPLGGAQGQVSSRTGSISHCDGLFCRAATHCSTALSLSGKRCERSRIFADTSVGKMLWQKRAGCWELCSRAAWSATAVCGPWPNLISGAAEDALRVLGSGGAHLEHSLPRLPPQSLHAALDFLAVT